VSDILPDYKKYDRIYVFVILTGKQTFNAGTGMWAIVDAYEIKHGRSAIASIKYFKITCNFVESFSRLHTNGNKNEHAIHCAQTHYNQTVSRRYSVAAI